MRRLARVCSLLGSCLLGVRSAAAQGDTTRVASATATATVAPARWHAQVTGYYSRADNGFGVWRGQDVRLMHSGTRVSPFVNLGSQTRPGGTQTAGGIGSYINWTPWMFSIVGIGFAPDNGVVLFPKQRTDASLFVAVPGVKGILVNAGVTDLRFTDSRTGGHIYSVGSMMYRGKGIYSGAVFFNEDRASKARSKSWQVGGQWGAQGSYWVGAGLAGGNEAYRLLSATPFDARFRARSASAFVSKWLTRSTGLGLRYDYEHKIDVYHRSGLALSYFVDF
jgi:YaiO family outer membrane protein